MSPDHHLFPLTYAFPNSFCAKKVEGQTSTKNEKKRQEDFNVKHYNYTSINTSIESELNKVNVVSQWIEM